MLILSKSFARKRLFGAIAFVLLLVWSSFHLVSQRRVPPGALVSLVRQRDLQDVVEMVRNVEDRYNNKFHHDWVFLSEEDFKVSFTETVSAFVSGNVKFRTINRKEHWLIPSGVDRDRLAAESQRLSNLGVPYGGSNTYRLMCRFQAGIFAKYLSEYRYYARIDPDVKLFCDTDYNIFEYMWRNNKKYGFTISLKEVPYAVENLWDMTKAYLANRTEAVLHPNNCLNDFIDGDHGFCHFWSNFEIADLNVFRSAQFNDFFQYLDASGGFFYNRWGDAPVHSLAMAMFLDRSELHYFEDIGMAHTPNMNCPLTKQERLQRRCTCPQDKHLKKHDRSIFTFKEQSCTPKFLAIQGRPLPDGWSAVADRSVRLAYGAADPRI